MNSMNGRPAEWGLPEGTRVQMRSRDQQKGIVMPYEPEHSHGLFPVRLDDGIWQKCDASDVIVLDHRRKPISERRPRKRKEVTTLSDQERR